MGDGRGGNIRRGEVKEAVAESLGGGAGGECGGG